MTCGTTPAPPPPSQATNPVPLPIRDPIATLPDEDEDGAAGSPESPITPTQPKKGKKAKGESNGERVKKAVGKPYKNRPGKRREKHTTVTQPWIRWFSYINNQVIGLLAGQSRQVQWGADPLRFDFSDVDYFSNQGSPGAGSHAAINGEENHPGIVRLTTDVNNGDIYSSWTPVNAAGIVRWSQVDFGRYVFRTPSTITSARFEVGMSSDPSANWPPAVFEFGQEMAYLFFDTGTDTALRIKTRSGGIVTNSVVLVDPCPAATWIDVTFQRRRLGASYVLDVLANGETRTTFTTGLPSDSSSVGSMFRVGTRTNAARTLDLDLADLRPTTISSRWSVAL